MTPADLIDIQKAISDRFGFGRPLETYDALTKTLQSFAERHGILVTSLHVDWICAASMDGRVATVQSISMTTESRR